MSRQHVPRSLSAQVKDKKQLGIYLREAHLLKGPFVPLRGKELVLLYANSLH